VDVLKQDLTDSFKIFTDEELLCHLQSGTLTPLATEVANEELKSRGIAPQFANTEAKAKADAAPSDGQTGLVTIAELWDPLQANVLRGAWSPREYPRMYGVSRSVLPM